MTKENHTPEIQHYVPKMLLRNFGFGKKRSPKINVFDKHRGEYGQAFPKPTSINNVVAERGFYDFEIGKMKVSIENTLAFLEDHTAAAFRILLNERNLAALSELEKTWIAIFVASQRVRSRHYRQSLLKMDEALTEHVRSMGFDPRKVDGWRPFENENELKAHASMFLLKNAKELSACILTRNWLLLETKPNAPFWIGDNPVAMHNDREFGPYGNIGLLVPGIQIYLPISPTLTLGMWCPELKQSISNEIQEARKTLTNMQMVSVMMPKLDQSFASYKINQARAQIHDVELLEQGLENGTPVPCSQDNVIFMNSLQVSWAYRFIMSNKGEFELAVRMMKEHPEFKEGHQMKFN